MDRVRHCISVGVFRAIPAVVAPTLLVNYMATRKENERSYPNWENTPDGGRRYWRERPGGEFGWCRYVKIVDADENTVSFVQEAYDDDGRLIEIHQKYPVDTGHQILSDEEKTDDHTSNSP